MHRVHALAQAFPRKGILIAFGAGLISAILIMAVTSMPRIMSAKSEQQSILASLSQTQSTIEKLKREKIEQQTALQKLSLAPAIAQIASLNTGGYTESDVNYWRKQMAVFGLMTGVNLDIRGRGLSQYTGATKLTVGISSSKTTPLPPSSIVNALDFLQLYGYVETFNGTEAVVHIKGVGK